MSQHQEIQEIIDLVKLSLVNGQAHTRHVSADEKNGPIVRYFLTDNTTDTASQYVAKVKDHEPEEISVARRLVSGNLNLRYVQQESSPELVSMLQKVALLAEGAFGFSPDKASLFDKAVQELYTQTISIYQHDPLAPDDKLVEKVQAGNYEATKQLDEQGYFKKVAEITIPTKFVHELDCKTVQLIGQDHFNSNTIKPWYEMPFVKLEPGVTEVRSIQSGDVMKLDAVSYRLENDLFTYQPGFVGNPIPEQPRLSKPRAFDMSSFFEM
jgi:hypothetical protein